MKLGKFTIAWDWQHSAVVIGSAIAGALTAYLQTQPLDQLLVALTSGSWAKMQPIVMGALVAVAGALIALAKHTFVTTTPPDSGAASKFASAPPPRTSFLPPPAVKRVAVAFVLCLASTAAIAVSGASVVGCTAAQWANFQTNASAFAGYVQTFLQGALMVWQILSPMLGANVASANKAFQDAYVACTNALGVFQDAVNIANAAQTSPDLNALMGPVKDACSRLLAVIAQFQSAGSGAVSSHFDELSAQGHKIWSWK